MNLFEETYLIKNKHTKEKNYLLLPNEGGKPEKRLKKDRK